MANHLTSAAAAAAGRGGRSVLDGIAVPPPLDLTTAEARSRRRRVIDASRSKKMVAAAEAKAAAAPRGGGGSDSNTAPEEHHPCSGGLKEIRMQARIMRNREAAALSRKRKSDHVGHLENRVRILEMENRQLRHRAALYERCSGGGGGGGNKFNVPLPPPPMATASSSYVDGGGMLWDGAGQTAGMIFPVQLPTTMAGVGQAPTGGGGGEGMGTGPAGVTAREGGVEPEAWAHGGARPFYSDGSSYGAGGDLDRLFVELMAED